MMKEKISHAGRPLGRPTPQRDSPLPRLDPPLSPALDSLLQRFERILIQTPAIDRFDIEAPVAADFECRKQSALELPIYRRRMNLQIVREFLNRQYVTAVVLQHSVRPLFRYAPLIRQLPKPLFVTQAPLEGVNAICVPRGMRTENVSQIKRPAATIDGHRRWVFGASAEKCRSRRERDTSMLAVALLRHPLSYFDRLESGC